MNDEQQDDFKNESNVITAMAAVSAQAERIGAGLEKAMAPLDVERARSGKVPAHVLAKLAIATGEAADAMGKVKAVLEKFDSFIRRTALVETLNLAETTSVTVDGGDGQLRLVLLEDINVSVQRDAGIELPVTEAGELARDADGNVLDIEVARSAGVDIQTLGFTDWLVLNGAGDLIQETVNASSLKAAIKAWIKKGAPPPETLFKITPAPLVSITKVKSAANKAPAKKAAKK